MKTSGCFRLVTSLCSGLLISLVGCYLAAETVSPKKINFFKSEPNSNEKAQVAKNEQLSRDELVNHIEIYLDNCQS